MHRPRPQRSGAVFSAPLGQGICGASPRDVGRLAEEVRRFAAWNAASRRRGPPPIFFGKENAPRPVEKKLFCFGFRCGAPLVATGFPRERKRSGSRGKRTSSRMSERRRLRRCEGYGACEDAASLRSRPLGRWARGRSVLWAAPTPNTGTRSGAPSSAAPFGD